MSRNIANTRPRDFYYVYILYTLRGMEYDSKILKTALEETAKKRGSLPILESYKGIIESIRKSTGMQTFWANYQKEFDYAKDISFEETCEVIEKIMKALVT